jgi:hypothetical protein
MAISNSFNDAAYDYLYLLEKGYPRKAIIKLIGDRYSLSGTERTLLYRGLATAENRSARASSLLEENGIKNKNLYIDGYNVLITIGSYLNGSLVFIANDHFLRDASEIHGKVFRTELFDRGIILIIDYLQKAEAGSAQFYLDRPVSKSGLLAGRVNQMLEEKSFPGKALTVRSPDYELKRLESGIVCTSDSTIIEKTNGKLFDLARHTLAYHFNPNFLDLGKLV